MTENWKAVPGYEGLYEVSDQGRVRGRKGLKTATRERTGYFRVGLSRDGRRLSFAVHRLVLAAFAGPCPEGREGCHNDGDQSHNALPNLRWDTPAANAADREAHGRTLRGEQSAVAKLTDAEVAEIRAARGRERQADLAARFGVCQTQISRVQLGRVWAHV